MKYRNVVLIFPTIALLSENYEKIISDPAYSYFRENFLIHTLSEFKEHGENNLFFYTPERFLSYLDKNQNKQDLLFDFIFVDEVYKIDNDYLIDDSTNENERDTSYRIAVHYINIKSKDILLAGPYIEFFDSNEIGFNPSFNDFLSQNSFKLINYNKYELVDKIYKEIKSAKKVTIDEISFEFTSSSKEKKLIEIVSKLLKNNENCIVYCATRSSVESYAGKLINSNISESNEENEITIFIEHLIKTFKEDWILIRALKNGIGIHHGLVPKYIQKEIIKLFNSGYLKIILSTTTITEGVNTSAKNIIVLHNSKGEKPLKKFDAKNISGRAGRFLFHFKGRVISLQNGFLKIIESEGEGIKHKNYDLNSKKDDVDIFYTTNEYLNEENLARKKNVEDELTKRGIPEWVVEQFKIISRADKIVVYDQISNLSVGEFQTVYDLIYKVTAKQNIDYDGLQTVLKIIRPIVRNQKLIDLIDLTRKSPFGNTYYSNIVFLIYFYLRDGFLEVLKYRVNTQNKTIDEAIKMTAEFVYNTLKYQVVKYLGVFNLMYKFYQSQKHGLPFERLLGIDRLLVKLEYNALTEEGRIASDFGVPFKVVDFYENPNESNIIKEQFDAYELFIFNKIESVIKNNKKDI